MVAGSLSKRNYVVAPDLRDISSRKGEINYVKKEFDCIGTEIFKKYWEDVLGHESPFWPHIFKAFLSSSFVKYGT